MLFAHPRTPAMHVANFVAPVFLGLLYAMVALNAAAGCGHGGECLRASDFSLINPAATRQADRPLHTAASS